MLSLFMCISGGDDWGNKMQPFKSLSSVYMYAFIFYIFFTVFGAVNVVTGLFVEMAAAVSRRDHDNVIELTVSNRRSVADDIRSFFNAADVDGRGYLSIDELTAYLKDDQVK